MHYELFFIFVGKFLKQQIYETEHFMDNAAGSNAGLWAAGDGARLPCPRGTV